MKLADEKLAHDQLQYQDAPKDDPACSKCTQFVAPNASNIVANPINPNGWCVAFAPKGG
jgi:coenzyme F420-reducing hydrogenase beta subunit